MEFAPAAEKQLAKITDMGYGNLPICMAKNQYSLSDDPKNLECDNEYNINVRKRKRE